MTRLGAVSGLCALVATSVGLKGASVLGLVLAGAVADGACAARATAPKPVDMCAARAVALEPVGVDRVRVGFTLGMWSRDTRRQIAVPHGAMRSVVAVTNGADVTVTWTGHPLIGSNFTVRARMTVLPQGGFEYTSFTYENNASDLYPAILVFPEVVVPRTEKTAIFHPKMIGEVYRPDWSKVRPGATVTSSGPGWMVFRCIATMEEDGSADSYLFDQRGAARRYVSSLQVMGSARPNCLTLRNVYQAPLAESTRRAGALPYTGACVRYRGGWYEGAAIHRAWMKEQPWFKSAAARDFSKFRDVALWMWSRGGIAVSEPPVHWFMKETGLRVALDWYWWHGCPYDTCYPDFWPPRDGADAFCAAVKRMRDRGAFVQVYTNGMLWDTAGDSWKTEGGRACINVHRGGGLTQHTYNPFTKRPQGLNCGEAPQFQKKMRALEHTLAGTGLDGVYMDMISCGGNMACFNPLHTHAPGGGRACTDGYRAYVEAVHRDNPGFLLSSEGTSEEYLDLFESFIVLYSSWERWGLGNLPRHEPVPAAPMLFRNAAVLYGSFATPGGIPGWDPRWGACLDTPDAEAIVAQYPDQFAVEFARGVAWGIQPMVHNFLMKDVANPRLAKDLAFMKETAKFYFAHRAFLFDGEMLNPGVLACARQKVDFLTTSSYERPHRSRRQSNVLPTILHGVWQAPDGRRAAILVNWTHAPQTYTLRAPAGTAQGTLPARGWQIVPLAGSGGARCVRTP